VQFFDKAPLDANYGRGGRFGLSTWSPGCLRSVMTGCGRGGCCTSLLYSSTADSCQFSGCRHNPSSVADQLWGPRPERGGGGHLWVPTVGVGRLRTAQGRPRGLGSDHSCTWRTTRAGRGRPEATPRTIVADRRIKIFSANGHRVRDHLECSHLTQPTQGSL
jgi:hypothetical protein